MSCAKPALAMGLLRRPGEHAVDSAVMCVVTRFGLRSPRYLLRSYREYRRVLQASRSAQTASLLQSSFLPESATSWLSFSIWSGPPAFSAHVPEHVEAARASFGWLRTNAQLEPELWSTKWKLVSVTNNLSWADFDLREFLVEESLRTSRR